MKRTGTSLGFDENLEALLCYLLGWVTGILLLLLESRSHFVKYHAMQSVLVFLPLFALRYLICMVPLIGDILASLLDLLIVILWVFLVYKAFRHKYCKLPVISKLVRHMLS